MAIIPHKDRSAPGDKPQFSPEGDCAIRVEFGRVIDPAINERVHRFCAAVEQASIAGVVETSPSFAVATVYYRPDVILYADLANQLAGLRVTVDGMAALSPVVKVPVVYGGEYGPDIDRVADAHGIRPADVVALHASQDYRCYMTGFMPGFPYLGELPAELRTPRLVTPRVRVPAGSVGIADNQTGIYPLSTPGGWNIIGRTPLKLFDPSQDPPSLIRPGDSVRFVAIGADEFERMM